MKTLYKASIGLCLILAIAFLTAGTAAALEPIGNTRNITETIAGCNFTVSGYTITVTDLSTNADYIECDWGDGNIEYIEPGETVSHTYTPIAVPVRYDINYTVASKLYLKIINFWVVYRW